MLVFEKREKLDYLEKNLSVLSREPTKLNPQIMRSQVIEPRLHWWEVSVLTSAPSLHP